MMDLPPFAATDRAQHSIVPRSHVKIASNVTKAWNLVQMNLLSLRSEIELEAFQKFSHFTCMAASSNTSISLKGKNLRKSFACIQKTKVASDKNS